MDEPVNGNATDDVGSAALARRAALDALARPEGFDLAVIGGGATGLAIALHAAWAGRSVALIEADDFASGTSSRSTKLLHGGVRYLAQGQIGLVREALRERASLIDLAPTLARPLRFMMPAYRWWERGFYGLGLLLYDRLSGRASLGPTRLHGSADTRRACPELETRGLRGAVSYCDAQFDDAGLAIAMARGAARSGAMLLNRVQAQGIRRDSDGQATVDLTDRETGQRIALRAHDVVNASGVWVDVLRNDPPMVQPSQGAHIVVERRFFQSEEALLIPRTVDGRVLFIVPWLEHCVMGTTDTPRDPADTGLGREPLPFSEEIDLILSEVDRVLRPAPTRADILSAWAGLRPLVKPPAEAPGAPGANTKTRAISREHAIEIDDRGVLTITGGKWTTCLAMARDALRQLPGAPLRCEPPSNRTLPEDGPDCAARVPTGEEVVWLARHTWARTVEDVLARRSRLMFLDLRRAMDAAPEVARVLEAETGRDPDLSGFLLRARSWLARATG